MDYKNLEMLSWLVAQFRSAGETGITFDQLIDKLVEEPNMEKILPKRTFHNYLKELRNRFGINIECDSRLQYDVTRRPLSEENNRYRYRLVSEPKSDSNAWNMPYLLVFETSEAMRRLQESEEGQPYMYIDCQASGTENLKILLQAIREHRCVDLYYHDQSNRFPYPETRFEPRGLVMKNYVWYLEGNTSYRMDKIWPLNSLSGIKLTDETYRPNLGFSAEKFWKANKNLRDEYFD